MFFFIVQSFPVVLDHHLCLCPEMHVVLKKLCCRINVLRVMNFHFHHMNQLLCLIQYTAICICLVVIPIIKIITLIPSPWFNLSSTIMLCIIKHEIVMCWILTSSHFSIGLANKCHLLRRTPNALSISFLAASCHVANCFSFFVSAIKIVFQIEL